MAENETEERLIDGPLPLTPKEEHFCRAYADLESATYGKATKSAEIAGYSEVPWPPAVPGRLQSVAPLGLKRQTTPRRISNKEHRTRNDEGSGLHH